MDRCTLVGVMARRRKGEAVTLYCTQCTWGSELSMAETEASRVVVCAHCGKPIYWHRCESCGLCYVGNEKPNCPACDDVTLDNL
jgi:hypothetical protein